MKRIVSTLTFLSFAISSFCQEGKYTHYSIDEGLPSNQVYDVIQDDQGFIWFSTDRGLSRFDGFNFENFTTEDGLTNNVVFDFYKQRNGDIWCTTLSAELFKIEGNPPQFIPHKHNTILKKYSKGQVPHSMHLSNDSGVYMSLLRTMEFLHIDKNGKILKTPKLLPSTNRYDSLRCIVLAEKVKESFFFLNVSKHAAQYSSRYNFLSETGIGSIRDEALYFDRQRVSIFLATDKLIIQSNTGLKELPLDKNCIASGKWDDNHFWIGLDGGGGYIFSLEGKVIQHFLPNYSVTQIFKDMDDNIWLSTLSSGVYMQRNSPLKLLDPVFKNDLYVNDLSSDVDGNLYIGYYNGNISKYNNSLGLTSFYKTSIYCPALIYYNKASDITYFHAEDKVFSSDRSFEHELSCRNLYSHEDKLFLIHDNTLVLKNSDTLNRTIFEETRAYDIQFFNDRYYAATESGLLFVRNIDQKSEVQKQPPFSNPIRALDNIYTYLIIGTKGEGVAFMNRAGEMVFNLKVEQGLSGNFISNLYVENDSTLWVATNKGLSRVSLQKNLNYQITSLPDEYGMLVSGVEDIEITKNTLWLGTQNGLYYMAKDDFGKEASTYNHPRVLLNAIVDDSLMLSSSHKINPGSSVEFHFRAISFDNVKAKYRYKLSKVDKEWRYTLDRNVIYKNLASGSYTFYVQFCDSDECWNITERSISFSIPPSFPWAWWINIIPLGIVGALFYFIYRNQTPIKQKPELPGRQKEKENNTVLIKHLGTSINLNTGNILFVKSSGNYLEFHTSAKKYLTRMAMSDFLKEVPQPYEFMRVHKSYSVRLDKIEQKNSRKIWIQNQEIPIGRVYKNDLMEVEI